MLHLLETLCAVVAAGSLNRAAEMLHLTQPAVTKQIRSLEQELKVQLLVRGPQGVTLTPVGKQIHYHARQALAAAQACRRVAEEWNAPDCGRLVVAAGLTLTLFTLPPVIAAFRRRHPGVQVAVRTGGSQQSLGLLLNYEADLAFVTSLVVPPETQVMPLFRDPLVLAAAPGHPLAHRKAVAVPDLAHETLISFTRGSGLRQYVDQVLEARGVAPQVVMEFDSIEAIKTMVVLNLGVALLPWSAVREDASQQRLAALPVTDWPDAGRTIALVWRRDGYHTAPMQQFQALARELLCPGEGLAPRP